MPGVVQHGEVSNHERGNVGNGVEICCAVGAAYPKALLPGSLETRIVAFTLGAQGVDALEAETLTANGAAIIVRDRLVLGTAAVFLAVVPIFVVARALPGLRLTERTAEFLTQSTVTVRGFSVLMHGKTCLANEIAGRKLYGILGVALVERDNGFSTIEFFCRAVNMFFVIRLVADEGTFVDGECRFRTGEDILGIGSVVVHWRASSTHRAAGRRCSQREYGSYNPSRIHISSHCAGLKRYGRRAHSLDQLSGGYPC